MNQHSTSSRLATTLALLWLSVWPAAAEQVAQPITPGSARVGTVSLILGEAVRISADGQRSVLERGAPIAVLDRIATASNGHVHIRFIDDALVSVRPDSELEIVRYEFNRRQPELSAVKFNLEEGVARSISGQAARAARERFRLNTPLAAIGVRGTDFVVSADADTTRARVYEGVIIMAPFSDACSINALGPCTNNALELAANTSQMAAMYGNGAAPLPRLLPAQNIRNADMIGQAIANSEQATNPVGVNGTELEQEAEAFTTGVDELATSVVSGSASVEAASNDVLLAGITNNTVTVDAELAAMAALIPSDFTPSSAVTPDDMSGRQLVWGRYAHTGLARSPLALTFAAASADRNITVGNFNYGLFRVENGSRRVADNLGLVGFQLNSAQAVYNTATGVVAMQVNGGSLGIDFQRNTFSTALQLSHELTGKVDFSAAGKLLDGGVFRAMEQTRRVAGAVSLDGKEAGYLFEYQLGDGRVSGLTLWDAGSGDDVPSGTPWITGADRLLGQ